MNDELAIQAAIVKDCNRIGYGQKMSNQFLAGVPDLFLAVHSFGSAFVELKVLAPKSDLVLLTKLQALTISKLHRAGVWAGVLAIRDMGQGNYVLYPDINSVDAFHLGAGHDYFIKERGSFWPIASIIKSMRPPVA